MPLHYSFKLELKRLRIQLTALELQKLKHPKLKGHVEKQIRRKMTEIQTLESMIRAGHEPGTRIV